MAGGAPGLANSAAEVRGQAPPVIPIYDGVTRYSMFHPETGTLTPLQAEGQDLYRAPNIPDRVAKFPIAFTVRSFGQWLESNFNSLHGEVTRQQGFPVGIQLPHGGAARSVVRPVPNAWDSGYWTDNLQGA